MAVNVKAVINVSQVVAKCMIDSGKTGSIVNISTVVSDCFKSAMCFVDAVNILI